MRSSLHVLVIGALSLIVLSEWALAEPMPRSPIRHLIVVVGENRSFDNVFGTYVPRRRNQSVWNLVSRGIITSDGRPGPNFQLGEQQQAVATRSYELSPTKTGPFAALPQPNTTLDAFPFPQCTMGKLEATLALSDDPFDWNWEHFFEFCKSRGLRRADYDLLKQGGTGQPLYDVSLKSSPVPDCRYPAGLRNLPYSIVGASELNNCYADWPASLFNEILQVIGSIDPITPVSFNSHTGDPVHRFYQMWQQSDCSAAQISADNPSGCKSDLYPWVATTVGWNIEKPSNDQETFQGGVAMGYYDMANGDWPYFKKLADRFAISDNYHQPVMGGTGPNSQFMFTGDVYYFTDQNGDPATPPADLIENPNPLPGSNNFYIQDQLGTVDPGNTGVAYTDCSDPSQPGVQPIRDYLESLPYKPFNDGNCEPSSWYQVNNNYPYFTTAGEPFSDTADKNAFPGGTRYSVGPQVIPTIGDALAAADVSWKYYGEGFGIANNTSPESLIYCMICNGFQYSRSIMTTPSLRRNLVDLKQFYRDLRRGNLPAVSYVKPGWLTDSHPGTSTPPLFEAFVKKLVNSVRARRSIWRKTAILVTYDEGGGYFDSGYIQPIDFFGDGPRTVMIAVSPHAKRGFVDHTYADHASILKFIEWNWGLPPLSERSRDNLPNPVSEPSAPYFPTNSPAIGDLTTLFKF
ncbi:MAG: alkaline phosphatase family protein [Thiohalocapsa sp.]